MTDQASAQDAYFLSYSRSDDKIALRLAMDLREQGIAVWVDQLDIRPSEHWDRAIERAVRDCKGLVVVVSPRSVASDNVADEISYAIDSGKSVLPVMIERCTLPLRITRMQVVDATDNYDRALERCLDELRRRDGAPPAPKRAEPKREPLDPAELSLAKQRLAPILGPIASHLVDKAAQRAMSTKDLYGILSNHIEGEAERERFLKLGSPGGTPASDKAPPAAPAPEPRQAEIPAAELESVSKLMIKYIGPIAPMVVKRESRASASPQQLRERLPEMISDQGERAEFLRLAGH